ncbi:hypothetical protein BREVNS_0843 [Brevinematales bacterium NS]|nr:hypothetical protein BREVNS_0843 [Brevinematales bacterium NS]
MGYFFLSRSLPTLLVIQEKCRPSMKYKNYGYYIVSAKSMLVEIR